MSSLSSPSKAHALLPRLRALLVLQRSEHTASDGGNHVELCTEMGSASLFDADHMESHNWRKLDSRTLGITKSMISYASLGVVKDLQSKGYEAYLVGGCVRDLLLKRIPKDFDVITTASLSEIRKNFHRSIIIGQRFPICKVFKGGSFVEVSSFDTLAEKNGKKNKILTSHVPAGCDERDILRWRNCRDRDFTINSLFYDPFVHKIYDYSDSLKDLKSLKLRTVLPAQSSFKEDCARILRGLRLAARLKFSFAKETETAIHKLSSSVLNLNKSRLFMELNYMLSYGAAERSLCLLKRYHLLEFLFPIHNAYVTDQSNLKSARDSMMLMKLFSNLDLLVSCDKPSDSALWLAILAFHTALVKDPQHALVVLAFASLLYHGNWDEGITYARGHVDAALRYDTEILDSSCYLSDDELAEKVTEFTTLLKASIDVLTYLNSLQNAMVNFPDSKCSGLVFVSQRMGGRVAQVFDTLVKEGVYITSLDRKRKNFEIDYSSLGKGDICETSFVLGKIILNTMIPAGCSVKEQNSKDKDGRDEINPSLELELSREKKLIGDQNRNVYHNLRNILKSSIHQSPQDEFQAIPESRNGDGNKKIELNHNKKFQLYARKHSKKLNKCNDLLARKHSTSMEDHHFLEDESVEGNKIVVGRDQPNLVHKRLGSKRDAEDNPKNNIKKVLAKLRGEKKEVLNPLARKHSKMLKKCHDVLVEKQGTSMQEDHLLGEKGVEENEIVVARDEPNLDRLGLFSERNAEHNLKNDESKKVLTRLGASNREELSHDLRVQLPAKKHSEILDSCLDTLIRKQGTSMQEHHFPEEEHDVGNKIVEDRNEPNLDRRGHTSEGNAEDNLENANTSKKAAARLSRLF